jgi:hypothetical protein
VVVAIIAVIAALTVPRMFGNEERLFRNTCDEVADLLTMYAQRDVMASQPVGLVYDEGRHWLMLVVYDVDPERGGRDADWRWDRLVQPVKLPEAVQFAGVRADGSPMDIRSWPLAARPGAERPVIELDLIGPSEHLVTFVLPRHGVAPRIVRGGEETIASLTPIDLNLAGRMREEW